SVTFVPLFTRTTHDKGLTAAAEFAEEAQAVMLAILIPLTAAFIVFMPWVMLVLAPGFERDTPRYDLTVALCRVSFPYLVFISVAALQGGVLNALDKFGPFAFAQTLFNVCLIAGLVLTPLFPTPGHALVYGELAAGVIQVIWMVGACRRAGIRLA